MRNKLETRPHPKKKGRVQVRVNGRWRSHKDFTATCWAWAGGQWCDGKIEYWTEAGTDPIIMRCQKCGATRRRWPGYKAPKPPEGGMQHGWLRTRRACAGY